MKCIVRLLLALLFAFAFVGCSKAPTMTAVHGKSLDYWVNALNDKDAKARRKAAEVLGNVGAVDPAVVPALIAALRDVDANVRAQAVLSLLKIGPPAQDAVAALTALGKDRDATVRAYAGKALERIQRPN